MSRDRRPYRVTKYGVVHPHGSITVHHDGTVGCDSGSLECRPVAVIDPEDRDQVERFIDTLVAAHGAPMKWNRATSVPNYQAAFRAVCMPAVAEPPTRYPIVHAVMYRDHRMGTLCDSGAWGTPELFTAVTEHVTCPGCVKKLEGARGRS